MAITQYITNSGERWDNIAFKAYGDGSLSNLIIDANPNIPLYDRLPAGLYLTIPIIDNTQDITNAALLPPWKQ